MHHCRWPRLLAIVAFAFSGLAGSFAEAARSLASEPVDQFLDALRARRYFDEAIDYLDTLSNHPHVPEDVRQRVLYEQGVTLLAFASGGTDPAARESQLTRAAKLFERFQAEHPQHEFAAAAKNRIAKILLERGRSELLVATKAEANEPARLEARKWIEKSKEQLVAAEETLSARWKELPKLIPAGEKDLASRKDRLSQDLVEVRLMRADADHELAQTFEAGTAPQKKLLQESAGGYARLYEDYRGSAAGSLARLWEGRCYRELGEFKKALGCFRDLMDLPSQPEEFGSIKTKSTLESLECWLTPNEHRYQEAIERGERWSQEMGGQRLDDDSMGVRYWTAKACQAQAEKLGTKDPNRKRLVEIAHRALVPVVANANKYQRSARQLSLALAPGKEAKKTAPEVSAFNESFERAKTALASMQQAESEIQAATAANDKPAIEAAKTKKQEQAAIARAALRQALTSTTAKTSLEELNTARYYSCFLAWDSLEYYDAAVLGEFLAKRYPDTAAGQQGARIALASYVRLFSESKSEDKQFEAAQVERAAATIFQQWPESEESDNAAVTMLNFSISQQKLDAAVEYLNKIAQNSPRRGPAELRAGQAMWSSYLRGLQSPAGSRPSEADQEKLKSRSAELLEKGIERLKEADSIDPALPAAIYTLAQMDVDAGQPAKAIERLEDPKFGPLTLIKADNPATARPGFALEAYKLALRAYIAVSPQQLKKAEEAMDTLEKLVKQAPDAQAAENLTAVYISLGRELQAHLQALRKAGKSRELDAVSKAFEVFLDRITKRESGGSIASLNWVGETYFSLGAGFDSDDGTVNPKAKAYFEKATAAYRRMLEAAQKDPKYQANPDSLIGLRLRLADCYAHSGDYEQAIKTMIGVIQDKPLLLSAQVQAAEIYQAQGATDPNAYVLAITGSTPGKNGNVIWGWGKISKMAAINYDKFEEIFHKARLNMAETRYRYALTQKDPAKRGKILEAAKQDLWYTYKLHSDLGGAETSARYNEMLKSIQRSLKSKEIGLEEFAQRDAAAVVDGDAAKE